MREPRHPDPHGWAQPYGGGVGPPRGCSAGPAVSAPRSGSGPGPRPRAFVCCIKEPRATGACPGWLCAPTGGAGRRVRPRQRRLSRLRATPAGSAGLRAVAGPGTAGAAAAFAPGSVQPMGSRVRLDAAPGTPRPRLQRPPRRPPPRPGSPEPAPPSPDAGPGAPEPRPSRAGSALDCSGPARSGQPNPPLAPPYPAAPAPPPSPLAQ